MNKENDNVVGRLGSKPYEECGSERMRAVPAEASQDEPGSYQREGSTEEVLPNYAAVLATLGATLIGTVIICFIISRMWDEDKIRIHVLGFLINFFRLIARKSGSLALEFEKSYYEYVDALH